MRFWTGKWRKCIFWHWQWLKQIIKGGQKIEKKFTSLERNDLDPVVKIHWNMLHFTYHQLTEWRVNNWNVKLLTAFSMRQVRSTTDTSGTGTRNAIPVSLPFSSGITFPTALAAPVEEGMMFVAAVRPPRQSLLDGPSTVFCVAVYACMVVIRPSMILNLSLITLASGARQFVVHDALLQHHNINIVWRWNKLQRSPPKVIGNV